MDVRTARIQITLDHQMMWYLTYDPDDPEMLALVKDWLWKVVSKNRFGLAEVEMG